MQARLRAAEHRLGVELPALSHPGAVQRRRFHLRDDIAHGVAGGERWKGAALHRAEDIGRNAQHAVERHGDVGMHLARIGQHRQARAIRGIGEARDIVGDGCVERARVARIRPGDGAEQQRAIFRGARHRSDAIEREGAREAACAAHAPIAALQSEQPVHRRR